MKDNNRSRLYLLKLTEDYKKTIPGFKDINLEMLICAKSVSAARQIAADHILDEDKEAWLEKNNSTCKWIAWAFEEVKDGLIIKSSSR